MRSKVPAKLLALMLSAVMIGSSCIVPVYADDDDDDVVIVSSDSEEKETTTKKAVEKDTEKTSKDEEKSSSKKDDDEDKSSSQKSDDEEKSSSKKDDDEDKIIREEAEKVDYSDVKADVPAYDSAVVDAADDDKNEDPLDKIGRYYDEKKAPVVEEQIVVTENGNDFVKNREDFTEVTTQSAPEAVTAAEAKTETTTEDWSWLTDPDVPYWFGPDDPDVREIELNMKKGSTINSAYYTSYMPSAYNWYSSDSLTVSINSSGVFSANRAGIAMVYGFSPLETVIFSVYIPDESANKKYQSVTIHEDDRLDLSQYVTLPYYNYKWYSKDTRIATISEYGRLTGIKEGTATIYADANGTENDYEFSVTVTRSKSSGSSSKKTKYYDRKFTIYLDRDESVNISEYLDKDPGKYSWEIGDKDVCKVEKSNGVIKGVGYGSTEVRVLGSTDYYFRVKVGRYYDNVSVDIRLDGSFDLYKYFDDPSNYDYTYLDSSIAKVKGDKIVGLKRGVTYIVCDNKKSNELVQIMVEVRGSSGQSSSRAQLSNKAEEKRTEVTTEPKTEITTSQPVAEKKGFKDISHRQWAVAAIENMAAKGYINGRSADIFAPDDQCSKADFTIVFTKMIGIENNDYNGGFDDVNSSKYYAKYVNVARQYGICAGVAGNNFKPENAITREEVMYMVYKGLELKCRNLDTDTSVL
ncbi:MAG: S-layer homology domain-containing protein, partial [Firmicutes bacterium]|nr:S-layer homology domain-containing protein [Bacillota bacterium]